MQITDLSFVSGFVRMCTDAWEQGWHEANGGNASYRLTEEDVAAARPHFNETPSEWTELPQPQLAVAGEFFLVTGAGQFMRNVQLSPETTLGLVEISADGAQWRRVWGFEGGGRPTSEFAAHVMIHAVRKQATNGASRVLYHCHPADVIALACAVEPTDRVMTRTLWKTMTECIIVFPEGIGVVPCFVPGSWELAQFSAEKLKTYRAAMWLHHGLLTTGDTFDACFGLTHVIVKAATIFKNMRIMCPQGGYIHEISDEDLNRIALHYCLDIPEGYLQQ